MIPKTTEGFEGSIIRGNFACLGDALDGSAYGMLSAGYAGSALDGPHGRSYIQKSMDFILSYSGNSFDLSQISNVSFQYGTTLIEPNMIATAVPVPEPNFGSVSALALLYLGGSRLVKRFRNSQI
jgi:hypothetical protein